MELTATPMTERQRKYRENYRERVAGWYNGWLHIVLIYTIGLTALYVYLANLHDVHHDWRVTFFPPYALVVFTLMSIPPAIVFGWLVSPNVGWLLITTTTSMYLSYEFMHFCCHVDENWFVHNMPFVNTIRRHHTAHHNQSIMMERNMNLTFPIMDCLLGTSDLNRGLLGHVFNGYSTRCVKTDMRKTARTPRVMRAAVPAE